MPLLRYFVYVGGALLALLFVVSAALPTPPAIGLIASSSDLPAIRIHSDRKLPERVVIDTTQPTITPPATMTAEAAPRLSPSVLAEMSAKARMRETFAQLVPSDHKSTAPVVKKAPPKRKIVRARPPAGPMMLVAQQPHFGLFNTMW